FGGRPVFHDRGIRRRAIAALGRQDTDPDGLFPLDTGIRVLGASSDHLILDVSDSRQPYKTGDTVPFTLNYGALLRAFTSAYVCRVLDGDSPPIPF
ncbi:MAG: hypothetical protein LBG74_00910, partial [Spirochaetaceae bacterium]|nr:hypothetical protein [Spirochaetaceae bacterium]